MAKLKIKNRNDDKSVLDKLNTAKKDTGKKEPGRKAGATIAAKKRGKPKYKIT